MMSRRAARTALFTTAATLAALAAHATAPPAGTVIGNRAAATYVNASGDTITVTSNEVETIVQQVGGVTLASSSAETAAPGGKVFLPHAITNAGNGLDFFDLTAVETVVGGAYDFTEIKIYPDANFDGVADSTTPITVTPTLEAGDKFGIVIEAVVPAGAAAGAAQDITITAASDFDGTATSVNTDTITVSSDAITEIVKSMTVADGAGAAADGKVGPGDIVTVTLKYSSTGLVDATDLIVTDQLVSDLTYVAGSADWSDSATDLTDTDDGYELTNGGGQQVDFQYDGTDTVTFQIDSVPSSRTGSVTFQAVIGSAAAAGEITNIATQTVNGTAGPSSNEAVIVVDTTYAVTAADAQSSTHAADPDSALNLNGATTSATDDDGSLNDIVTESSDAFQGAAIRFEFLVTNQSNATETIDLSVANGSFPAGTTFQLLSSDGATPIVGPVGPLAPGAATRVNVVAKLAPDATAVAAGSTNYTATLSAIASSGGVANTSSALFTGAVLAAAVDLENSDGTGDGPNPTNGGDPWQDVAVNPGDPATYTLTVQNNGPVADSYSLALDTPLPSGWTVEFLLPDGTPVTSTGAIPSGQEVDITVVVTPPADATPVDQPVTVKVASPSTGQSDTLTNAVIVNTVADLAIVPSQTVQVAPGGVQDIAHTLKNEGNIAVTEGAITLSGLSAFSGALFHDVDGSGTVSPGDTPVDNIDDIPGGLAPGAAIPLILRVQAPSTGAVGANETATLTVANALNNGANTEAAGTRGDNVVNDTILIVTNDLTLAKEQALDADCDGSPGAFVSTRVQAKPGQCIRYHIVATNTGSQNADTVIIRDTTPGYTALTECGGACAPALVPGTASMTNRPVDGAAGALESSHGDLLPGEVAELSFTVRIQP